MPRARRGRRARARARLAASAGGIAPRAQAAERRLRGVSAEALCALGRLAEASAAFRRAIAPPSPRRRRARLAVAGDAPRVARLRRLLKRAASAPVHKSAGGRSPSSAGRCASAGEGAASRARRARRPPPSSSSRASDADAAAESASIKKKNVDVDAAAARRPISPRHAGVAPRAGLELDDAARRRRAERARATPRARPKIHRAPRCRYSATEELRGARQRRAPPTAQYRRSALGDGRARHHRRPRARAPQPPPDPTAGAAPCVTARAPTRVSERVCERALAVHVAASRGRRFATSRARGAARPRPPRRAAHHAPGTATRHRRRRRRRGSCYAAVRRHGQALGGAQGVPPGDGRGELGSTSGIRDGEAEGASTAVGAAHRSSGGATSPPRPPRRRVAARAAAAWPPGGGARPGGGGDGARVDAARRGALARAAGAAARAAAAAAAAGFAVGRTRQSARRRGRAGGAPGRRDARRPQAERRPTRSKPRTPETIDADHCQPRPRASRRATDVATFFVARAARAYARSALAAPHRAAAWFDLAAACVVSGDAPEPEKENAYARYARAATAVVSSRASRSRRTPPFAGHCHLDPANPAGETR